MVRFLASAVALFVYSLNVFFCSFCSFVLYDFAILTVLTDLRLPSCVRGEDAAVRYVGEVCRSPSWVLWICSL